MDYIIGVDLDNTIIDFNALFFRFGIQKGYLEKHDLKDKKFIRDKIRHLTNGEKKWHDLQLRIYGKEIFKAKLYKGVKGFFRNCQLYKIPVFIISHKTELSNDPKNRIDLREKARQFLGKNKLFAKQNSLTLSNIFFEDSRQRKIQRIAELGCTHFIDDLTETFMEPEFPKKVHKILFCPQKTEGNLLKVQTFTSWKDINEYFFKRKGN